MTEDPHDRAVELADYWTPMVVRLFGEAGVFHAFGREHRRVDEVAAETGTHADTVSRMVRALVSRGVFERVDGEYVRLTEIGRRYLPDEPGNVAGMANFKPYEHHAWADALHTLKTGEPSFPVTFGKGFWNWLAATPEANEHFNDAMRRRVSSLLDGGLDAYEWPATGTVVDVGGGSGMLLERVLHARPTLRGVVFDQPHVVRDVGSRDWPAGVRDRIEVVAGDFFQEVPSGGDVYVLSSILHDWDDAKAVEILRTVGHAMTAEASLVLFESVLRDDDDADIAKLVDLHMLVLMGARERTLQEWSALLRRASFTQPQEFPTPGLSWLETRLDASAG